MSVINASSSSSTHHVVTQSRLTVYSLTVSQAPPSMGFSRQEYWNELPCPPPGDLPNPGIEPASLMSPALAGRFFTASTTWEARLYLQTFQVWSHFRFWWTHFVGPHFRPLKHFFLHVELLKVKLHG